MKFRRPPGNTLYLKEVEYRFNHRTENLFKLFLTAYFGYLSH